MNSEAKTFTEWKERYALYENKYVPLEQPMVQLTEAEYDGRKVELDKPSRSSGKKKYVVYVKSCSQMEIYLQRCVDLNRIYENSQKADILNHIELFYWYLFFV